MKLGQPNATREPTGIATVGQPGVLISNAWPQSRTERGATARAITAVLQQYPFFEAYQTVDIPFADERELVRKLLHDAGRPHTYTLTRVLAEQSLNLSSLDPAVRERSCAAIIAKFDDVQQVGASGVGLISGPRPTDPAKRADALAALEQSLVTLATEAKRRGAFDLILEPLDYFAHKKCTLGTTEEAVGICDRLAARGLSVRLCLDVAHLVLNGEDVVTAVEQARRHIAEFHFCNAVLDKAHPQFGDHHLFFGAPGVIDQPQIAEIMAGLMRIGYLSAARRPRIYCEVWQPPGVESLAVVAHCQTSLCESWIAAQKLISVAPMVASPS